MERTTLLRSNDVSHNPQITADARLMDNYVLESPVNGGGQVVTVRDTNSQLNAFTIGTDGSVYHIYPDTGSDTGWSQTDIGIQAKRIAVGITSSDSLIVFAVENNSTGNLFHVEQVSSGSNEWSTPAPVPRPSNWGNYSNAYIAVRNFPDGLYIGIGWWGLPYHGQLAYGKWNDGDAVFNIISLALGSHAKPMPMHLSWGYSTSEQSQPYASLYFAISLPGYNNYVGETSPYSGERPNTNDTLIAHHNLDDSLMDSHLEQLSVFEDKDGTSYIFGVLSDGYIYYLEATEGLWVWNNRVLPDTKVVSFGVTNNANNEMAVLAVSATGTLYQVERDVDNETQWSTPWPIKQGLSRVGTSRSADGSSEAFAIGNSSRSFFHISQDLDTTEWEIEPVELQNMVSVQKFSSYTIELTLLDINGRPSPNCEFKIKSDSNCALHINGIVAVMEEEVGYRWMANAQGKVFLSIVTDTVSAPLFTVWTACMPTDQWCPVQPNLEVQDRLKALTPTELLDASDLLTGQYHTESVANSLVSSIDKCMDMASGNAQPLVYNDKFYTWAYRPKFNSYHTSSDIDPSKVSPGGWQMDFTSGLPRYSEMSSESAAKLIQNLNDTLPQYRGATGEEEGVSWGDIWNSIKNDLVSLTSVTINGVQATITLLLNDCTYVYNAVISAIQQAFDLVQAFFDKVAVTFEKLYEFLKFVLNWDDIKLTQQVIASAINQMFDTTTAVLEHVKSSSDTYFEKLISDWCASFEEMENSVLGEQSFLNTSNTATPPEGYYRGANNNLILNSFTNHANEGKTLSLMMSADAREVQALASSVLQTLESYATEFKSNPNFLDATNYFNQMAEELSTDIDKALQSLMKGLLKMLSGLVQAALSTIKKIIDAILDGIIALIQGIQKLITTTLDIPFLKEIYAEVVGSDFTLLNVFSLILAIPTTVVYKIIKNEAPFANQDAVDTFNGILTSQNILQASGITSSSVVTSGQPETNSFQNFMRGHVTFISLFNMFSYAPLAGANAITDLAPDESKEPYVFAWSLIGVIAEGATIVTSCPWFYSDVPPSFDNAEAASNASWLFLFIPMAEDVVALAAAQKRLALVEIGGPILSMITGGGLIALFAVVADMQRRAGEYSHELTAANMLSTVPSVFALLRLVPPPYSIVARPGLAVIAGGCGASAGILYFTYTNSSVSQET